MFSFKVNRGVGENEGRPVFNIKNNDVTPEELVSRILSYLRTAIIDDRGFEKNTQIQAVIAVPINFNDKQIKAYKYACEIAKMDILDVISEPKAAIYAYGFNSVINANILVLRIGGTSFDVSIHNVQPENNIILKSYYFSTKLGGNDFDERIFQYFANDFKKIRNIDILTNIRSVRRLKNACERSKRTLSSTNSASIVIDSLINGVDLCTNITRDKFNELCIDLFDQIVSTIGQQLIEVGLSKFEISEIVLVGGSSRIPKIKSIVEDFFEGKKTPLNSINPDEVIAYGAMAYAGSLDLNKE